MSRIGKNPVSIPSGVEAKIDGQHVEVKGPKGTLSLDVPEPITVVLEGARLRFLVLMTTAGAARCTVCPVP